MPYKKKTTTVDDFVKPSEEKKDVDPVSQVVDKMPENNGKPVEDKGEFVELPKEEPARSFTPRSSSFHSPAPRFAETETDEVYAILDTQPEGHGFFLTTFVPSSRDVYISQSQIRRFS